MPKMMMRMEKEEMRVEKKMMKFSEEEEKMPSREMQMPMIAKGFAPSVKPKTLDDLLLSQSSSTGAWSDLGLVMTFFKNPGQVDAEKASALAAVTDSSQLDLAWATLLALFVLQTKFADRESEWQLIATKAKKYLKSMGLAKPEAIIRGLSFDLN